LSPTQVGEPVTTAARTNTVVEAGPWTWFSGGRRGRGAASMRRSRRWFRRASGLASRGGRSGEPLTGGGRGRVLRRVGEGAWKPLAGGSCRGVSSDRRGWRAAEAGPTGEGSGKPRKQVRRSKGLASRGSRSSGRRGRRPQTWFSGARAKGSGRPVRQAKGRRDARWRRPQTLSIERSEGNRVINHGLNLFRPKLAQT
jgi:hypothetical protein